MADCHVYVSLNVCLELLDSGFADMTEAEQVQAIRGCLMLLGEERLLASPFDYDFEEVDA